jgi:hypothetical protein
MGDFLGALFGGSNKTLNQTIGNAGSTQGFTQGVGQTGTTDALKYYHDILSGGTDALAPEISAGQDQAQQQKGALAEFGTRSGGTAAASAGADAANRTNIINMLAKLKSGAAGSEAQIGSNATGQSLQANDQEAQQGQQRMQNWLNSILGGAITGGVNVGMGAIGL